MGHPLQITDVFKVIAAGLSWWTVQKLGTVSHGLRDVVKRVSETGLLCLDEWHRKIPGEHVRVTRWYSSHDGACLKWRCTNSDGTAFCTYDFDGSGYSPSDFRLTLSRDCLTIQTDGEYVLVKDRYGNCPMPKLSAQLTVPFFSGVIWGVFLPGWKLTDLSGFGGGSIAG